MLILLWTSIKDKVDSLSFIMRLYLLILFILNPNNLIMANLTTKLALSANLKLLAYFSYLGTSRGCIEVAIKADGEYTHFTSRLNAITFTKFLNWKFKVFCKSCFDQKFGGKRKIF